MPPITALLHTMNDALRLGRTLETLFPCTEILIVDHNSADATRRIARQYGARLVPADGDARTAHYLDLARHDWIFCLQPGESITEGLQASLFEWSTEPSPRGVGGVGLSVFVREQTIDGWLNLPSPETRLIPRGWTAWNGRLPAPQPSAVPLKGELLRFALR
jgi:glycosyltransferase involved in cell wall biosynthesis